MKEEEGLVKCVVEGESGMGVLMGVREKNG